MDIQNIKELIDKGLSAYKIAEELNVPRGTLRHYLKKYNLKTIYVGRVKQPKEEKRRKSVIYTNKRRRLLKIKAVEYKGGKCEKCGYSKCVDALDFHHLNPEVKSFGIGDKGYTRSWEKVREEVDKCILVCANCHRELHSNIEG